MKIIVSIAAFAAGILMASPANADFVLRDGQYVWVGPETSAHTTANGSLSATDTNAFKARMDQNAYKSANNAKSIIETMATWFEESGRANAAHDEAEKRARELALLHPGTTVVVPVFSNKPAQLLKGGDAAGDSYSIAPPAQVNSYNIGPGQTYNSREEALRDLLGPIQPQIRPADRPSAFASSYLRYVVTAKADGRGGVQISPVTQQDQADYRKAEEDRMAAEAKQRQEAAAHDLEVARQKEEEAKKKADEEAKKKAEEERKAAEQKVADEKQRAEAQKKSHDDIKAAEDKRDKACSASSNSTDCMKAENEVHEIYVKADVANRTALCMSPDVVDAAKGGPCDPEAPPCPYCRRMESLSGQALLDRQIGTRLFVVDKLSAGGALSIENMRRSMTNLLNGRGFDTGIDGLSKFGDGKSPPK